MSGPTRVPDEADKPTTTNTACTHQTPHDHGTRLCYQADACRCTACSAAWVRYQRRRRGLDPEPDGRRKPSHTPLGTSLAYAHPVHVDDDPFPWFAHCGCGWRSYRKASKRDAGREAAAHLINVGLSWAAGARPQLVDTDTGGVYLVAEHPCGHMCRTCAIRSRRLAGVS